MFSSYKFIPKLLDLLRWHSTNKYDYADKFPLTYYSTELNRIQTAESLMSFGSTVFREASCVYYFNQLSLIDFSKNSINKNTILIGMFSYNYLFDSLRIIACFENYMKAKLILNKYLAHKLNNNHPLKNKQNRRPIHVSEIVEDIPCPLDSFAIRVSDMLNSNKYIKLINLPNDIVAILKKMLPDRNRVHFINRISLKIGKETINEFKILIDFVNNDITQQIRDLEELKMTFAYKIPIVDF